MEKNFIVDQFVGLSCEGQYYDLHNCYDFDGFNFDVSSKTVKLLFEKNSDVEGEISPRKVTLIFAEVDYFELSPEFVSNISRDLSEIGYKNSDDRDHDWLIDEIKSTFCDHMFIRFARDQYIRIHCRLVTLRAE